MCPDWSGVTFLSQPLLNSPNPSSSPVLEEIKLALEVDEEKKEYRLTLTVDSFQESIDRFFGNPPHNRS